MTLGWSVDRFVGRCLVDISVGQSIDSPSVSQSVVRLVVHSMGQSFCRRIVHLVSQSDSREVSQLARYDQSTDRSVILIIAVCHIDLQGSFQQMWISKQEYEDQGKGSVERKCP